MLRVLSLFGFVDVVVVYACFFFSEAGAGEEEGEGERGREGEQRER